ncbi:MAG: glutathione S-transferase family protein [Nitratireductor sp.]|nr:glutathione S-transferase family protein [Nitratireductor sp.]
MLKIFHHPMSASSRYIRLLLAEYGQSVEMTEEKPWARRTEFLTVNPANTLPVMFDNEGEAICGGIVAGEYLDETCGSMMRDKRLMPENPVLRAEVRRLVEWFLIKFENEVTDYLITERVYKLQMTVEEGGGAPDSSIIRAARANLKSHLHYIDWLARNRNWLAGIRLSHADMAAAAALSVLDYLGEVRWEAEPAAKDWYARIKSRPSFRPLLSDKVQGLPPASQYIDLDF